MNIGMKKIQENDYDDVETAGVQENTQYARSLTRRRHNMPIHTIASPPTTVTPSTSPATFYHTIRTLYNS